MADTSVAIIWGPPIVAGILGGLFTVGAAYVAYLGAKRLEHRKQRGEQFRTVYAHVLEDVVLYLNYHSLWRDRSGAYDTSEARLRILNHVKDHFGDFGPKVVTSYLAYRHSKVRDNLRGGRPSHLPIFWHLVDEAYQLIKDNNEYGDSFKKQMQEWRADYFLWCMLGGELFSWCWNIKFADWTLSYDDLVRRHESSIVTWYDVDIDDDTAPPAKDPERFIRAITANKKQADQLIAFMGGHVNSPSIDS